MWDFFLTGSRLLPLCVSPVIMVGAAIFISSSSAVVSVLSSQGNGNTALGA